MCGPKHLPASSSAFLLAQSRILCLFLCLPVCTWLACVSFLLFLLLFVACVGLAVVCIFDTRLSTRCTRWWCLSIHLLTLLGLHGLHGFCDLVQLAQLTMLCWRCFLGVLRPSLRSFCWTFAFAFCCCCLKCFLLCFFCDLFGYLPWRCFIIRFKVSTLFLVWLWLWLSLALRGNLFRCSLCFGCYLLCFAFAFWASLCFRCSFLGWTALFFLLTFAHCCWLLCRCEGRSGCHSCWRGFMLIANFLCLWYFGGSLKFANFGNFRYPAKSRFSSNSTTTRRTNVRLDACLVGKQVPRTWRPSLIIINDIKWYTFRWESNFKVPQLTSCYRSTQTICLCRRCSRRRRKIAPLGRGLGGKGLLDYNLCVVEWLGLYVVDTWGDIYP